MVLDAEQPQASTLEGWSRKAQYLLVSNKLFVMLTTAAATYNLVYIMRNLAISCS